MEGTRRERHSKEAKQLNPAPEKVKVLSPYTSAKLRSLGTNRPPPLIPSSMGHVKSRVNLRGPPRKAKYSWVTDSEPVPRGKGEKNPRRGVKQTMNP